LPVAFFLLPVACCLLPVARGLYSYKNKNAIITMTMEATFAFARKAKGAATQLLL